MKYILENIYTSNDCYIIKYNGDNYMKIRSNGYSIDIKKIKNNNLNILIPNADLYLLYKFPFEIIEMNNGDIVMSFLPLLNSYISFYMVNNMLFIMANIDNVTVKMSYVYTDCTHDDDYFQIYVQGVRPDDIQKLSYLDDTQIYNMGNESIPFIYIYMPYKYINKLIKMCMSYRWKLVRHKTILF